MFFTEKAIIYTYFVFSRQFFTICCDFMTYFTDKTEFMFIISSLLIVINLYSAFYFRTPEGLRSQCLTLAGFADSDSYFNTRLYYLFNLQ